MASTSTVQSTVQTPPPADENISEELEQLNITLEYITKFKKSMAGRFFLMLGGADFFHTYGKYPARERTEELNRLQLFLKKVNSEETKKSVIFAFDKYYDLYSVQKDIFNLNRFIKKNSDGPAFEGPLIMGSYSKKGVLIPLKETYSFPLWFMSSDYNTQIFFFNFNLESFYKDDFNMFELYELIAGNTTIQNIVEKCVPKEGSLFSKIQSFLNEKTFSEYYLYNCAWIGANRQVSKINEAQQIKTKMINIPENKYYEGMCELLHIFRNLPNSFILTAENMNAFNHPSKELIKNNIIYQTTIYKIPLNVNTSFIKRQIVLKGGAFKKTYQIHDNGGRPFSVEIEGKKVNVIQHKGDYVWNKKGDLKWIPEVPKKILAFKADEIFIGKKSPGGGYDGLPAKKAEGNSILLKVGPKYVYIGSEIYEFDPVNGDEIQEYYSDIGNSDVPYPYAVGKTHIYVMLEKKAVDKSYFHSMKDIYSEYWFDMRVRDCRLGVYVKEPPFCKNIKKHPQDTKKKLKNLKQKTRKLKKKILVKRDI